MGRMVGGVGAVLLLVGCSSGGGPVVESGPRPSGSAHPSGQAEARSEIRTSTAATLGIPPGHLPPPGRCRIWIPGVPPGHQGGSGSCALLERRVPPGAWLVYRPSKSHKEVRVSVYDADRPRVTLIRIFDAATGALLREVVPESR